MEKNAKIVGFIPILASAPGFVTPVFSVENELNIQDVQLGLRVGFLSIENERHIQGIGPIEIQLEGSKVVFGFYLVEGIVLFRTHKNMADGLAAILPSIIDRPALSRSIKKFIELQETVHTQVAKPSVYENTLGSKDSKWNSETIEILKLLWSSGRSASQIGATLGFTRNEIIVKVHSLNLNSNVVKTVSEKQLNPPQYGMQRRTELAKPRLQSEKSDYVNLRLVPDMDSSQSESRVTILNLSDDTCKWPIGDPKSEDFCFCGHKPDEGSPYCKYHAQIAYSPLVRIARLKKLTG